MRSNSGSTVLRGMPSTRQNMSASASGSPLTIESEHEPSTTVVTPWRTDSESPASISTSAS